MEISRRAIPFSGGHCRTRSAAGRSSLPEQATPEIPASHRAHACCLCHLMQAAPRGLESAMSAHAAQPGRRPPMGGHTGGLTVDSLHLPRSLHTLVLDEKTAYSGELPGQLDRIVGLEHQ